MHAQKQSRREQKEEMSERFGDLVEERTGE
jgi:hypothetical protein